MPVYRYRYSHASISIDGREDIFYSFNLKGFVIEKPKKRMPATRMAGSICIRMQVPESVHAVIEEEINHFLEKKEQYIYSRWGVLLYLPGQLVDGFECRYSKKQLVYDVIC